MDVDPLQDAPPPRYAIESDSEDESPAPLRARSNRAFSDPTIEIKPGSLPTGRPLIVANDAIGGAYARGAQLGEQIGAVYVDGVQVGLLFSPSSSGPLVLISEATATLPLRYQHPYAQRVLAEVQPTSISVLTTYTPHTYASAAPTSEASHSAPLRYLSNAIGGESAAASQIPLYAPPNLLSSTAAAFLTLSSLPSPTDSAIPATAILAPTSASPRPPPKVMEPHSHLPDTDAVDVSSAHLVDAHRLLYLCIGQEPAQEWSSKDRKGFGGQGERAGRKGHDEIGEGSMYI